MAKKKFQPAEFQTDGCSGFVRIYHDFLGSPAWQSLTLRQRGLYVEFLRRYKEKRANGEIVSSNADGIHFSTAEAIKPGPNGEPPMYTCKNQFLKDVDALIGAGFIRVAQTGYYRRTATLYGFSSRWKQYQPGKPPAIPQQDRRRKAENKTAYNGKYIMSITAIPSGNRPKNVAKMPQSGLQPRVQAMAK